MILRSGKVIITTPKSATIREDLISKLPDALLLQILTLLPKSDANRTRFLSKRWSNLYKFLPNLHFIMPCHCPIEEVIKFHDFVDQTLALRDGMPIQKFALRCSTNCDYNRVYDWICDVVRCKVQEINLSFPGDRHRVRFCWDLFRICSSLVSLTLEGEFVLHVPDSELLFPCLKKIKLISIVYSGDESFANLISGCPVLEELSVERYVQGGTDNMKTIMVCSPSLKRLSLSFIPRAMALYRAVIDAPNLEYVYILDLVTAFYSMTKPLSLNEARIETGFNVDTIAYLMTSLSSARVLDLADTTLTALRSIGVGGVNMPAFPNLVRLVVGVDVACGWQILPALLRSSPNLEHIRFSSGLRPFLSTDPFRMRWFPGPEVPACLQLKMKEIIIENWEAVTREEFDLIGYMLRHSNNLETLTLNAHEIDAGRREELLNFPRGSASCRIQFV